MTTPRQQTYLEKLLSELAAIESSYGEILDASHIQNIDPNRRGSGMAFIGFASWGWAASNPELEAARMALLRRLRDWEPRFRLLFPHPTPTVSERLDKHIGRLVAWLIRESGAHGVPPTVGEARETLGKDIAELRSLTELLAGDEFPVRLVVDTNALIDNPDVAAFTEVLGKRYMAHLLPVVLRELDDLKRGGRTQDLRDAAQRADKRLKGLRTNGDVRVGVRVAGDVYVRFEHIEPGGDNLPSWIDLTVPDDRFVASSLLLQSDHPGCALHVGTSDINLQTKLAAVGIPFIEPRAGN